MYFDFAGDKLNITAFKWRRVWLDAVPRGSLEVVEYVPRQDLPDAIPASRPCESEDLLSRLRLEHRVLTSCVAALAALALHVAFVAPVLWGGGASSHRQELSYRGDAAMRVVVLADSSGNSASISPPSSPPLRAIRVRDALPMPSSSAEPAQASDPASGQPDGQSGLGAMYGRYLGQIHARIDRAWRRPRTAIGAPIFQCQVQLDQDSQGQVLEVTLFECNGGTSWQLSLVHAIEAASPLPAPPTPAVFAHHVLVEFRAAAYSTGAAAELYEPPGAVPVDEGQGERDRQSQNAFQALREAARAQKPRAIGLRIEGSKVEVESDRQ